VLLAGGISYFVYAEFARSGLDEMNVPPVTSQVTNPSGTTGAQPAPSGSSQSATDQPVAPQPVVVPGPVKVPDSSSSSVEAQPSGQQDTVATVPIQSSPVEISQAAIAEQQLYPGQALKPGLWNNPLGPEDVSPLEASLIQDFRLLDSSMAVPVGTLSGPTRIFIPSIGVNSKVDSLKILDLGDSRAYETPKHVVGHIPQSANPGEAGSSWLFGHLESPIQGEGNVFSNLPQIPDLLRKGENVYAVVENGQDSYLYRITETKVVHQDDLAMYDTGESTIHLVTCVPRWVYDHRLIVTGQLVGVK
jgi:LPXTG-site transpeptidase (sortase) family protein